MSHLKTKIAEYGIIFNEKEFLMLRFSETANPNEKWIFPGGRVNKGEKPREGLRREVKEETSLDIEILSPCDVAKWGEGEDNRYAIFFICELKGKNKIKLSEEHKEYRWFSLKDLNKIDFHDKSFKRIIKNAFQIKDNNP